MLPPALLDMLRQWWEAARPQGWLFPGRPPVNPLTYRQLNRIFHAGGRGCRDQEAACRCTPCGIALPPICSSSKLDIRMIQALLGHMPSLDTTALYTRVATDLISRGGEPARSAGQERQEGRAARRSPRPLVPRPALEVADIFRDHGAAWREANRGHMSLGQLKVMSAIERCRTAALGGHVARCENDNARTRIIGYNSCRDRHCPKCQGAAAREWLAEREAELLPVPYFHVVFTLPAPIADIAFQNKRVIYDLLFKASAETHAHHRGRPKASGRADRPHVGAPHLGLGHDPSSARAHDRAGRRAVG